MAETADARITEAYIDGLTDAMTMVTFLTSSETELNAIVRALTDLANDPKRQPQRRELLRQVAMQLHDQRIRNKEWKAEFLKMHESE